MGSNASRATVIKQAWEDCYCNGIALAQFAFLRLMPVFAEIFGILFHTMIKRFVIYHKITRFWHLQINQLVNVNIVSHN